MLKHHRSQLWEALAKTKSYEVNAFESMCHVSLIENVHLKLHSFLLLYSQSSQAMPSIIMISNLKALKESLLYFFFSMAEVYDIALGDLQGALLILYSTMAVEHNERNIDSLPCNCICESIIFQNVLGGTPRVRYISTSLIT